MHWGWLYTARVAQHCCWRSGLELSVVLVSSLVRCVIPKSRIRALMLLLLPGTI